MLYGNHSPPVDYQFVCVVSKVLIGVLDAMEFSAKVFLNNKNVDKIT